MVYKGLWSLCTWLGYGALDLLVSYPGDQMVPSSQWEDWAHFTKLWGVWLGWSHSPSALPKAAVKNPDIMGLSKPAITVLGGVFRAGFALRSLSVQPVSNAWKLLNIQYILP